MKEYIFSYRADGLDQIPARIWNRVLSCQKCMPEFSGQEIRIIYAYVELKNRHPVYCHRIDTVKYFFDFKGYYIPPVIADPGLLKFSAQRFERQNKVTDIASYRNKNEFKKQRYWDMPPVLLDRILDIIWSNPR